MFKKLLFPMAILCLITVGCKKDKDDNPAPVTPSQPAFTSATNPEVGFKINGTQVTYKNDIAEVYQGVSTGASIGQPNFHSVQGAYFYQDIDVNTSRVWFNLDKGTMIWPAGSLDTTTWKNFFAPGSYPYVSEDFSSAGIQHGIEIGMEDANGMYWSTTKGSADQTGSSFKIDQSIFFMFLGDKNMKVKFTFNCKVYDDAGNMKTITDGSGVLNFDIYY